MHAALQHSEVNTTATIAISGSKSETNRLLLLQALFPKIQLKNTSVSDDSEVMVKALRSKDATIDIHHAGTAMRFLTAYFAMQEGREILLTGSSRMKERPIKILVDALRQIGADISYEENDGFPPLRIKGKNLLGSKITIAAGVSSQYISALLLIAPKLENGLEVTLEGELTSKPYLQMTLNLLHQIGVETIFDDNKITVFPTTENRQPTTINVESDWSSASYYYSIIALSKPGTTIRLSTFSQNSLQGDSALIEIYKIFGVETTFENQTIRLTKSDHQPSTVNRQPTFDLNNTPDIAQTIAVTCFGLGLGCHLTGLHTLKIKETDRLAALQIELAKMRAVVSTTDDSLTLQASTTIKPNIGIDTYNDHRMAMAFAPLALKVPIAINDAEVVSKSYPDFWNDLKSIGFKIELTQ